MTNRPLSTAAWQRLRRNILATRPPICGICGEPINLALPGTHPDGPTIDHIQPRSQGGSTWDPSNCTPAHQRCNSGKRDRQPRPTTRNW